MAARKKKPAPAERSEGGFTLGGKLVRDLPIAAFPSWDSVTAVRGALLQQDQGKFDLVSMLLDAMEQDDRVKGVQSARYDGLLGLPLEMHPPDGEEDNAKAVEIAEACEQEWSNMAPVSELRDMLRFGRGIGFVAAEKVWTYGDRWVPKLKTHHPRFVYWTWGTGPDGEGIGAWRGFNLITQDGVVMLDPRDAAIRKQWVMYAPYGHQRGWAKSLVRALAIPWLARSWAIRDWARYSEVHGMPIRVGEVPSDADKDDKDRFIRELAALANESVIRAPREADGTGFAVKLVEAAALGWEAFKGLREEASDSISIAVLGQNLTTSVKGGSFAAAKVHDTVRQDIIASDAGTLSEVLRTGLLMDFVEVNFGPQYVELTPWPTWATDPPQDLGARAQAFKTFGEGLTALRATQLPVDVAELCERFEVPLVEGEEIPDYEPPAPAPVQGGQEPGAKKGEAKMSRASARRAALAAQLYVDEVADHGREAGASLLSGDLRALKAAISGATSYSDMRDRLLATYRDMDPTRLARLMEKCLIMARLAGNHAVLEEL
jgi:phage gp29-like protein